MEPRADVLFEVSYEVCNKVGGIYAVLESKAARMVELYKDNYFAIGPYYPGKAILDTIKQNPPKFCEKVFSDLKNEGINCHFGKWMIQGKPNVILVDFNELMKKVNTIKFELWKNYKIDSLGSGYDFDEPVAWSIASGIVIEKLLPYFKNKKVICHFHEWLSGGALLHLEKKVPTVFTTHATILGRTIAGCGEDLYAEVNEALKKGIPLNPKRPYKYGIQAKHLMEKVCAEHCNIFSTTSEITAREAIYIIGKQPDIILPNGLDMERFPTMEEFALLHRKYKDKIKNFLNAYFNPYYETNLWDSMIFFTSGRYEFRNKGYDIFIESLGKLNEKMKKDNIKKNIFVFFYVPKGGELKENIEVLESIKLYDNMRDEISDEIPWIEETIINSLVKNRLPRMNDVLRKEFIEDCKRKMVAFRKQGNPPFSAFEIENDEIINAFKKNNLLNRAEDKVKVIFYPSYLSTTDRLLSLNYEQAAQGSHLGVFPSYYEPWGYTPLEVAANGVLSITTDLSGFGIFIKEHYPNQKEKPGIMVLERENKSHGEVVEKLFELLWYVVSMNRNERIPKKAQAKDLASLADWKILIKNYIQAHNMALERFHK
jgi:glycogen(starch) synthase